MSPKVKNNVEPSPGGLGPDGKPTPTGGEALLFFTVIKNMKSKPDVDWDGVAQDNGFKNAETAKVRFGQVKRKLGLDAFTAAQRAATSAAKTPRPRAKKDATGPSTPPSHDSTGAGVKKSRSTGSGRRGAKPKMEEFVKDDHEALPTPTKPRRSYNRKKPSPLNAEPAKDEESVGDLPALADGDNEEHQRDDEEADMEMDDQGYGGIKADQERERQPGSLSPELEVTGFGRKNMESVTQSVEGYQGQGYTSSAYYQPPNANNNTTFNTAGYEGFNPRPGVSASHQPFPMTEDQRRNNSWFKQAGGIKQNIHADDEDDDVASGVVPSHHTSAPAPSSMGLDMSSYMTTNMPGPTRDHMGGAHQEEEEGEKDHSQAQGQAVGDDEFDEFVNLPAVSNNNANGPSAARSATCPSGCSSIFGNGRV